MAEALHACARGKFLLARTDCTSDLSEFHMIQDLTLTMSITDCFARLKRSGGGPLEPEVSHFHVNGRIHDEQSDLFQHELI